MTMVVASRNYIKSYSVICLTEKLRSTFPQEHCQWSVHHIQHWSFLSRGSFIRYIYPNQVSAAHLIEDIRREVLAHYHVPTAAKLQVQWHLGVKYFDESIRDKRCRGIFCRLYWGGSKTRKISILEGLEFVNRPNSSQTCFISKLRSSWWV